MQSPIPNPYEPSPQLLANRCILITGAGDGLGRATALACARHGASVILLGRTVRKLEAVYDEIERAGGVKPAIYPLNLGGASWKDYADLAATLEGEVGALDGLVHSAVHFKSFTPLDELDPREWIESLQVNLTAAFALTRHCMPLLLKAPDASVVFISDAAGRKAKAFHGAYGVSKAGIESLASTWAQELETTSSIRINSFDPGPMRTTMRRRGYPGEIAEHNPEADSVAPSILWLLGPDSRGVTARAL